MHDQRIFFTNKPLHKNFPTPLHHGGRHHRSAAPPPSLPQHGEGAYASHTPIWWPWASGCIYFGPACQIHHFASVVVGLFLQHIMVGIHVGPPMVPGDSKELPLNGEPCTQIYQRTLALESCVDATLRNLGPLVHFYMEVSCARGCRTFEGIIMSRWEFLSLRSLNPKPSMEK